MLNLFILITTLPLAYPFVQHTTFVPKHKLRASNHHMEVKNEVETQDDTALLKPTSRILIDRRQWLRNLGFAAGMNSAAAALGIDQSTMPSTTVPEVCDVSVESYRKGNKRIHIVGTAHVSSVSASLAGGLVREVKVCLQLYNVIVPSDSTHNELHVCIAAGWSVYRVRYTASQPRFS